MLKQVLGFEGMTNYTTNTIKGSLATTQYAVLLSTGIPVAQVCPNRDYFETPARKTEDR
jgi:hypothetical protein